MIGKFSIIFISTSLFVWLVAAIYLLAKVHYNYNCAVRIKRGYENWSQDINRIELRPTGHEIGKLFKNIYPHSPFPKGEVQFPTDMVNKTNIQVNFVKDFPIYNSVDGISLSGATNLPDIKHEERSIIYGMYRDCKDMRNQIHSFDFWICFVICFPSQVVNIINNVLSIESPKKQRNINIVNVLYWIYEIISIWFMLYTLMS